MGKKIWIKVLAIAFITAISGIVEINPLGTDFRFAVASIILMFALFIFREVPLLPIGIFTAVFIFLIRVFFQHTIGEGDLLFIAWNQFPGALYYFLLVLFLYVLKVRKRNLNPVYVGGITIFADVAANLIELVMRDGILAVSPRAIIFLLGVSTVRVVWVVSIVSYIHVNQAREKQKEERTRLDELLIMASGLYTEAFFLKKAVSDMEEVMADCYMIYRKLLEEESWDDSTSTKAGIEGGDSSLDISRKDLAPLSLQVAKKVHDIKKDSQRTLGGLEKFTKGHEYQGIITLRDVIYLVIRSNINLIRSLGKDIKIEEKIWVHLYTHQVYIIISILNNLVANSLEALKEKGTVEVGAKWQDKDICIWVADSGPGINASNMEIIFDPGYTSKFNKNGTPSTGIGLIHVKGFVESLRGKLEVCSGEGTPLGGAEFKIIIPVQSLVKGAKQ